MTTLHLKVKAGSMVNQVMRYAEGKWVMKVKALPVGGEANEEIIRFLSQVLKVPKSLITMESGFNNPYKKLSIQNLSEEEATEKLKKASAEKN